MNLHWIDWSIVGGLFVCLVLVLTYCQKYVNNTADFLAANRCAGRYILTIASGIGGLGAISIIAIFEMYYNAGFTPIWWEMIRSPLGLVVAITGWVFYRLRETRALTLAQFLQVRYSRNFRVFAGVIAWISGIVNYGIFPAVGTRFFINFCGIPRHFQFLGVTWETYAVLLALFIGLGVIFACCGGQIAIMVTDFFQGMFCNAAFLIFLVFFFFMFDWSDIFEPLIKNAAPGASMINPFETTRNRDFSIWYFLIGIVSMFYCQGAWQGAQGYQVAAKTPHEAKMSRFLGEWRMITQMLLFLFIPICAFAVMHNPKFTDIAMQVKASLAGLENPQLQKQLIVPMVLTKLLPVGLIGVFAAVMLAAMLSTDNTYMHSWGSIFIQDIIMPFRKKAFSPKKHIFLLRLSIFGVGVFAWIFSYFFRQTEYIMMFFAITGAIWLGGAGAVIIGGLYWKKGTASAAWCSMIIGSGLATSCILLQQFPNLRFAGWMSDAEGRFFINGQMIYFLAIIVSTCTYVTVSLLSRMIRKQEDFNLDQMLHRGKYDSSNEHLVQTGVASWLRRLGLTEEFTRGDRVVFFLNIGWCLFWVTIFAVGTITFMFGTIPEAAWIFLWKFKIWIAFVIGVVTTIWFFYGGCRDIRGLFAALRDKERNDEDDGMVFNGQNAGETT